MISDYGIDAMFNGRNYATAFEWLMVGNAVSPTPVRRDSAPTTFTQVGNGVTASGGFFTSADVGRIIKYNDGPGTEVYITGFTSATLVTVGGSSASIGPVTGTVWYVNRTGLGSPVTGMAGSDYSTIGGDNGTLFGTNSVTLFRKIIGGACTSATTLTEVAFGWYGDNASCWDLDIITGGVAVGVGDQAVATCQLVLTYANTTPQSVANVATGYDSTGTFQIETLGCVTLGNSNAFQQIVRSNGVSSAGSASGGPGSVSYFQTITGSFTQSVYSPTAALIAFTNTGEGPKGATTSYTNGSFFLDTYYKYILSESNGTIYGLALTGDPGYNSNRAASLLFTTPFTKNSTQTLDFTVRKSLQRILVN
jgi:hypothetical protein